MLYVHVPFCRSKCHFCDWVQPVPKSDLLLRPEHTRRETFITALSEEIRSRGRDLTSAGYTPLVIYWGGGTASSLSETEVEAIAKAIQDSFELGSVTEATME